MVANFGKFAAEFVLADSLTECRRIATYQWSANVGTLGGQRQGLHSAITCFTSYIVSWTKKELHSKLLSSSGICNGLLRTEGQNGICLFEAGSTWVNFGMIEKLLGMTDLQVAVPGMLSGLLE